MRDLSDASVLVVGATGGIGSAVGRALARRGARLTLAARHAGRLAALVPDLQQAGAAGVAVVPTDLATRHGPPGAVEAAVRAHGRLDGVVNAAGVVAFGPLADLDDDTLDDLLAVNLAGPLRLARAALAHLPEGGFLVQCSAVVAEAPVAGMAAYGATKAGLTAADVALAREVRRRRIQVLDARPPHTETGLATRPIAGEAPRLPAGLDPAVVAERIVVAVEQGERDLPAAAFGATA